MSPRAFLLAGTVLCVCVLVWMSRSSVMPPGAEVPTDGAVAMSVEGPSAETLAEITAAPAVSEGRVDGLGAGKDQGATQAGAIRWSIRFACRWEGMTPPQSRRLDVAVEGAGLVFEGTARRRSDETTFSFTIEATPAALEGATLFAATRKRALFHRSQAPFRWDDKCKHYRLGQTQLASASWDREAHALGVPHFELVQPKFLGHVLLGENVKRVKEFFVWTQSNPSKTRTLEWDASKGGNKLPFAAFVSGGTWGADDRLPAHGDRWLLDSQGSPVGTDVYLFQPVGVLELTLNLVSLPDARSVLIRSAASGVPSALTAAELNQRAAVLGNGVTTLSDKVGGRGLQKELALGKTTLPSGEYAVEAWSEPDSAGLMYLVASKNVTLTVGTHKFTLQ